MNATWAPFVNFSPLEKPAMAIKVRVFSDAAKGIDKVTDSLPKFGRSFSGVVRYLYRLSEFRRKRRIEDELSRVLVVTHQVSHANCLSYLDALEKHECQFDQHSWAQVQREAQILRRLVETVLFDIEDISEFIVTETFYANLTRTLHNRLYEYRKVLDVAHPLPTKEFEDIKDLLVRYKRLIEELKYTNEAVATHINSSRRKLTFPSS